MLRASQKHRSNDNITTKTAAAATTNIDSQSRRSQGRSHTAQAATSSLRPQLAVRLQHDRDMRLRQRRRAHTRPAFVLVVVICLALVGLLVRLVTCRSVVVRIRVARRVDCSSRFRTTATAKRDACSVHVLHLYFDRAKSSALDQAVHMRRVPKTPTDTSTGGIHVQHAHDAAHQSTAQSAQEATSARSATSQRAQRASTTRRRVDLDQAERGQSDAVVEGEWQQAIAARRRGQEEAQTQAAIAHLEQTRSNDGGQQWREDARGKGTTKCTGDDEDEPRAHARRSQRCQHALEMQHEQQQRELSQLWRLCRLVRLRERRETSEMRERGATQRMIKCHSTCRFFILVYLLLLLLFLFVFCCCFVSIYTLYIQINNLFICTHIRRISSLQYLFYFCSLLLLL